MRSNLVLAVVFGVLAAFCLCVEVSDISPLAIDLGSTVTKVSGFPGVNADYPGSKSYLSVLAASVIASEITNDICEDLFSDRCSQDSSVCFTSFVGDFFNHPDTGNVTVPPALPRFVRCIVQRYLSHHRVQVSPSQSVPVVFVVDGSLSQSKRDALKVAAQSVNLEVVDFVEHSFAALTLFATKRLAGHESKHLDVALLDMGFRATRLRVYRLDFMPLRPTNATEILDYADPDASMSDIVSGIARRAMEANKVDSLDKAVLSAREMLSRLQTVDWFSLASDKEMNSFLTALAERTIEKLRKANLISDRLTVVCSGGGCLNQHIREVFERALNHNSPVRHTIQVDGELAAAGAQIVIAPQTHPQETLANLRRIKLQPKLQPPPPVVVVEDPEEPVKDGNGSDGNATFNRTRDGDGPHVPANSSVTCLSDSTLYQLGAVLLAAVVVGVSVLAMLVRSHHSEAATLLRSAQKEQSQQQQLLQQTRECVLQHTGSMQQRTAAVDTVSRRLDELFGSMQRHTESLDMMNRKLDALPMQLLVDRLHAVENQIRLLPKQPGEVAAAAASQGTEAEMPAAPAAAPSTTRKKKQTAQELGKL